MRGFGIREKIRCGLRFFGIFLCGFAVFGPPLRPPPSTVTGPYADTLSISFSAMYFFTSKYSWLRLYSVLSRTCHELPNKQRWRPDEQP